MTNPLEVLGTKLGTGVVGDIPMDLGRGADRSTVSVLGVFDLKRMSGSVSANAEAV